MAVLGIKDWRGDCEVPKIYSSIIIDLNQILVGGTMIVLVPVSHSILSF